MELKERMAAWREKARRLNGGRSIHTSTRGAADMENVGYGLAVLGGIVAVASLVAVLFVPVATFTTLDAELGAALGIVLLVAGVGIKSAA